MKMRPYRTKLTLLLGGSLLALAALFVAVFGRLHYTALKRGTQQQALALATAAAAMLDVKPHESVTTPEHMATPAYRALAQRFDRLLASTAGMRRVYSLRPDDGKGDGAVWRVVVDGSPGGTRLEGGEADFAAVGSAFDRLPSYAKRVFKTRKPAVDKVPTHRPDGWLMFAYAPLVDKGKAIGVVGVAVSADAVLASMWPFWLLGVALLVFALLVAATLASVIAGQVHKPLAELRAATERVTSGDLSRPLLTPRDDELKAVFDGFNMMMQSVHRRQEMTGERAALEARLALAETVQSQLLSSRQVDHPAVRISQYARTADIPGGDWAHYHVAGDRWLYMLCGDVVGHGPASAMVSAAVAGSFEGIKLDIEMGAKTPAVGSHGSTLARRGAVFGVGELMRHLHKVVLSAGHGKFPMTMFALLLDLETGLAEYVCSGQPAGRIVRLGPRSETATKRANSLRSLRGRSGFIGFDGDLKIDIRTERLVPGDAIVLFSDGLVKRRDARGRLYGSGRIDRLLRTHPPSEASALGDALLGDLSGFAQGSETRDDVSLMVAHFNGPADDETLEALEEKRKHAA